MSKRHRKSSQRRWKKYSKNILKKMLTKINKNVIIENVDKSQQDLRKSKIDGKIFQKNIFKKC